MGAASAELSSGDGRPARSSELGETAIQTLARIGTPQSVEALIGIAMDHENREDRQRAAEALAALSSEPLLAHLLQALRTTTAGAGVRPRPWSRR